MCVPGYLEWDTFMGTLNIRLFGKLQIQRGDQVLDESITQKARELLAYLLLYDRRMRSREILAALLWDKSATNQSLKYLRQTLWQLQAALESTNRDKAGHLLLVEADWIGLNPQADLWLDVAMFEQAFTRAQGVRGQLLDAQNARTLQDAAQLYRGDLLEGWYQDWCLYERERLQSLYLAMLDKLMGYCEARQEYETGVIYGTQALQYDRARERTHRRLMRLHYWAGNRTAALRQYERCAAALKEELDVAPAKRTMALHEQIQADRLDTPSLALIKASSVPVATLTSLPEVLDHLKHLHLLLTDAQRRVEEDIQAVERILRDRR